MIARLTLALPWAPEDGASLDGLTVQRGPRDLLDYLDGILLDVRPLDPSVYGTADELQAAVRIAEGPGRVVLVAGAVPIAWRAGLRASGVSFLDVSGVAEIRWPRIEVSAGSFAGSSRRHRKPVPLQKGHALVAQELLIATTGGAKATIGEIAHGASVTLSTASRAITQLAGQGLASKHRVGSTVTVSVTDRVALTARLADRTSWPGPETVYGYAYGRNAWDLAARITVRADDVAVRLAVTGRAAAGFLGVIGASSPSQIRCWASVADHDLPAVAKLLKLEPVPTEEANVAISADPWRIGLHRARPANFEEWTAMVAHPLRVWCDLHDEPRGAEFAAQLWSRITDAG